MPKTSLIADRIPLPNSIIILIIFGMPSLSPLAKPEIKYLGILSVSFKPFVHFEIASEILVNCARMILKTFCSFSLFLTHSETAVDAALILLNKSFIIGDKILIVFFNTSCVFIQSLNLTIASPTFAVRSTRSISKPLSTDRITPKAIFNEPPTNILTVSRVANKPLKVFLSFSALSSESTNFSENLWMESIILYITSEVFGRLNVSFHAFAMD